jgi:hypothetical protein
MVVAQHQTAPGEGVLVERAGVCILAQLAQVGCEPARRGQGLWVVVAEHSAEAREGVVLELPGLAVLAGEALDIAVGSGAQAVWLG